MIYVDTSAALLVLLGQEGAASAQAFLNRLASRERVTSSVLLQIEMMRALHRERLSLTIAQELLDGVELMPINDDVVERACAMTEELKSLDAIHLATALLLDDPRDPVTVFTHDVRLADAARSHGLAVFDPLAA
ncbi:type II toxin-antitoxin system VapC family toxin [Actinomyces massiliensis]|uniref:type II toxin-antitoxin system VapC family toxin n=1 Tax=Actinomyces massiliensis TaxID=461393 RepID=UPI0028EE019F|nr:type II toxin-antitoxin system VapC family toxin [Actinomyces massiliensis]